MKYLFLALFFTAFGLAQEKKLTQSDMENSLIKVFERYENEREDDNRGFSDLFSYPESPPPVAKMGTVEDAKFFMRYAAVIHCPKDQQLNWTCNNCIGNTNGTSNVVYFEDTATSSNGYLALNHKQKLIILSYIGTVDMYAWIYNFNMLLTSTGITGKYSNSLIHSGFKKCATNLYSQSAAAFIKAYSAYPNYRVVFAAHSIGAPIAALIASTFAENNLIAWEKLTLITYGQPRIGNLAFAEYLNSKPWTITRVTSYGDILPDLPSTINGFHQNQYNMHIGKNGEIVPCSTTREDSKCTSDFLIPDIFAHNSYWGMDFNTRCNVMN